MISHSTIFASSAGGRSTRGVAGALNNGHALANRWGLETPSPIPPKTLLNEEGKLVMELPAFCAEPPRSRVSASRHSWPTALIPA